MEDLKEAKHSKVFGDNIFCLEISFLFVQASFLCRVDFENIYLKEGKIKQKFEKGQKHLSVGLKIRK